MVKRRIVAIVMGLALLVATTGLSGVAVDALGYAVTPQAIACNSTGGSGGGC